MTNLPPFEITLFNSPISSAPVEFESYTFGPVNSGGLYIEVIPFLLNNIIADNDSAKGSGMYISTFALNVEFFNSIILAKTSQTAVCCVDNGSIPLPIFIFDDFYGPQGTSYCGVCSDQTGKNGNISSDPLFKNPSTGNYGFKVGLPAIDSGSKSASFLAPSDIIGNKRISDGNGDGIATVDIGAFEFNPAIHS